MSTSYAYSWGTSWKLVTTVDLQPIGYSHSVLYNLVESWDANNGNIVEFASVQPFPWRAQPYTGPPRGGGGQMPRGPATFRARQGPQSTLSIWDMRRPYIRGPYMRGPVTALPRGPDFQSVALALYMDTLWIHDHSSHEVFSVHIPPGILSVIL